MMIGPVWLCDGMAYGVYLGRSEFTTTGRLRLLHILVFIAFTARNYNGIMNLQNINLCLVLMSIWGLNMYLLIQQPSAPNTLPSPEVRTTRSKQGHMQLKTTMDTSKQKHKPKPSNLLYCFTSFDNLSTYLFIYRSRRRYKRPLGSSSSRQRPWLSESWF